MNRIALDPQHRVYGVLRKNVTYGGGLHPRLEIVLVTEGELMMRINRDTYTLTPGDAVFIDAYELHSFCTEKTSTCAILEFLPEFCREIYAPFYQWISTHTLTDRMIRIPEEIFRCVLYLLPEDCGRMEYYDTLPSHFYAIMAPLFYAIMKEGHFTEAKKQTDEPFRRAAAYIFEHYEQPLTRETVAAEAGVQPQSLSRMFSRRMGMTFLEYVHYIRVFRALRSIESGEKVLSAAYSAGFESIRTFNRVCKSVIGMTPTEYLQSL